MRVLKNLVKDKSYYLAFEDDNEAREFFSTLAALEERVIEIPHITLTDPQRRMLRKAVAVGAKEKLVKPYQLKVV